MRIRRSMLAVLVVLCVPFISRADDRVTVDPDVQPYFALTKEDRSKLVERLKLVELGASSEQIKSLLGEPDRVWKIFAKGGPTRGFAWVYYVYRKYDHANVLYDRDVSLAFSNDGVLRHIRSNLKEYLLEEGKHP